MPHHTPPTPRVGGGGGGACGVGGCGGALEAWVLDEYRIHVQTYTHVGTRITVGKNWEFQKSHQI